jgi:hypothetical protein
MTSEESRLSRWSRRKAETRAGRGAAAPEVREEGVTPELLEENADLPVDAAKPGETGQEAPGQETPPLDLPDIDTLTADSDFTAFMKEGVPKALRRQALRKLWASDPVFNFIDGMEEYGEDCTDAATVIKGMKSAWEVGKGYPKEEKQEPSPDLAEPVASEEIADGETHEENARGEQSIATDDTGDNPDEDDEDLG